MLFRTPDEWRFAVHFDEPRGVADGRLDDPAPSGEPGTAQAALHRRAEELAHRRLEIAWREADGPGWWTGTVTGCGPLRP
ncbi:hypothetical protein BU198_00205 [Streptomyces sp. CBMA156]|nr:hypothetical protein [Streptomyces sp. CBMA156]